MENTAHETILEYLNSLEGDYRGEAQRIHVIAVLQGMLIDQHDIHRLATAAARAFAANQVRKLFTLLGEEASNREVVIRRVGNLMEEAMHDETLHRATLGVYFDVLRRLRLNHNRS